MKKVAMVQLAMEQCWTENSFYKFIEGYVKEAKDKGADVVVFPEDLNFCLAWVKESKTVENIKANVIFEEKSIKNKFESFIDWLIIKLHLREMGEWVSQFKVARIIHRVFYYLALKYSIVIVAGSIYVRKKDGIYSVSYIFENNGKIVGEIEKHKLVSIEESWGVKPGRTFNPVKTSAGNIGVCICYDLDDKEFIKSIVDNGAEYILAPSGGYRPYPNYPFNFDKETPQIQRSKENNIFVLRPYCAGWIFPGIYFQGHTMAVNNKGEIIAKSKTKDLGEVIVVNVDLKSFEA